MSDSWKKIGGYSRTGTQNYVRNNDATMGGTTFASTDASRNALNSSLMKIGDNAGIIYINGDIDMTGGADKNAPINRIKNVRDPSNNQDVATKHYVDRTLDAVIQKSGNGGYTGSTGPHGIGLKGDIGSQGNIGPTGSTGIKGDRGDVTGVKGEKGDTGAVGPTGSTGARGITGPVGPAGPAGNTGIEGTAGNQGANGTILWLNVNGISLPNTEITDQWLITTTAVDYGKRTVGPISVSATYGNSNWIIPTSRFYNKCIDITPLQVIPSGIWTVNLYADVPTNSDTNQISMYAGLFLIQGTEQQPSPDSLIIETESGDSTFLPPRDKYLPTHIKYIGRSWKTLNDGIGTPNFTISKGNIIKSTVTTRYTIELPVEFVTLRGTDSYLQLQIYLKNTKDTNQSANARLYFQYDITDISNTTYSYIQTTLGVVGSVGPIGSTGSNGATGQQGLKGNAGLDGKTGAVGPTGSDGIRGPQGLKGTTGPTGPRGFSNSQGPQYSLQYRSDNNINDLSGGDFAGNTYLQFLPPNSNVNMKADPSGTLLVKDLSCVSIHSPFYVTNELFTDYNQKTPRTFISGGGDNIYPFIATGTGDPDIPTLHSNPKSLPSTHNNIVNGIKFIHNLLETELSINMYNGNSLAKTGIKIDKNANVYAGQSNFIVSYSKGSVGIGGINLSDLEDDSSSIIRKLHVKGLVMVGGKPGVHDTPATILLNGPVTAPAQNVTAGYPGLYHQAINAAAPSLNIGANSKGLGIISPDFITFQTGTGATQTNSVVINSAGDFSVIGRTNLNGPVCINKNFIAAEASDGLTPQIDLSGTMFIRSTETSPTSEKIKLKLISNAMSTGSTQPQPNSNSHINEICGTGSASGGFLRLSAEDNTKCCIDLTGTLTSGTGKSVRIYTSGTERFSVNGSGNIGLHNPSPTAPLDVIGNTILQNSLRVGSSLPPTVSLDVTGAAKISNTLDMNNTNIINLASPSNDNQAATKTYVDTEIQRSLTGTSAIDPTVREQPAAPGQISGYLLLSPNSETRAKLYKGPSWNFNSNTITTNINGSSTSCTGNAVTATSASSAVDCTRAQVAYKAADNQQFQCGSWSSFANDASKFRPSGAPNVALIVYPLSWAWQSRPWRGKHSAILFADDNGGGAWGKVNSNNSDIDGERIDKYYGTFNTSIDRVGEYLQSNYPRLNSATSGTCVAFFQGFIQLDFIVLASDKRIKKNIKHIQDDDALLTLRKLKVSRFEYIDKIKKTPYNVYGFVAQDIKHVLPETTNLLKDYIPNFYFFCMINEIASEDENNKLFTVSIPKDSKHKFIFTGNHDNSGNEYKASNGYPATDDKENQNFNVRFYDISYNPLDFTTTQIIDDTTFKIIISNERYEKLNFEDGIYFIYGQEVDDFHKIDKEHIYNVTTAALQEVDRQQQSDKQKITELEKRVAELDSKVAEQQSIITDILERLKKAGI